MISVGFVIAFKPKKNSKDWKNDSFLLYATIESIVNQKSQDFMVYVVHHELPLKIFESKNVIYLKFPFDFFDIEKIENAEPRDEQDAKTLTYFFDQGKKIMYGASVAKINQCRYIMSVDADDLISNNLVSFISTSYAQHGWYVNSGYVYYTEKKMLLYRRKNMNALNGSTNIINSNDIPDIDFYNNDIYNFNFFSAHGYLKERLMKQGKALVPIPFPSIIYIAHTSNWFGISHAIKKTSLRNVVKIILLRRRISKRIIEEFKLY